MSTLQRATQKLSSWNQWLIPVVFVVLCPWSVWVTRSLIANDQRELVEKHVFPSDVNDLRAEMHAAIANLPPLEWKTRIITLERDDMESNIQMAKIETMLIDIRERVIRLDEQHRSSDKSTGKLPMKSTP